MSFYFLFYFVLFIILGANLRYMEVPRLGVESKLQLLAYTTTTLTWDLSHIFNLHHSSQQRRILNPLNEARDGTHFLVDTSWVLNLLSHSGNLLSFYSKYSSVGYMGTCVCMEINHINILQNSIWETWARKFQINFYQIESTQLPSERSTSLESLKPNGPKHPPRFVEIKF